MNETTLAQMLKRIKKHAPAARSHNGAASHRKVTA
jgi:hypothetical protein